MPKNAVQTINDAIKRLQTQTDINIQLSDDLKDRLQYYYTAEDAHYVFPRGQASLESLILIIALLQTYGLDVDSDDLYKLLDNSEVYNATEHDFFHNFKNRLRRIEQSEQAIGDDRPKVLSTEGLSIILDCQYPEQTLAGFEILQQSGLLSYSQYIILENDEGQLCCRYDCAVAMAAILPENNNASEEKKLELIQKIHLQPYSSYTDAGVNLYREFCHNLPDTISKMQFALDIFEQPSLNDFGQALYALIAEKAFCKNYYNQLVNNSNSEWFQHIIVEAYWQKAFMNCAQTNDRVRIDFDKIFNDYNLTDPIKILTNRSSIDSLDSFESLIYADYYCQSLYEQQIIYLDNSSVDIEDINYQDFKSLCDALYILGEKGWLYVDMLSFVVSNDLSDVVISMISRLKEEQQLDDFFEYVQPIAFRMLSQKLASFEQIITQQPYLVRHIVAIKTRLDEPLEDAIDKANIYINHYKDQPDQQKPHFEEWLTDAILDWPLVKLIEMHDVSNEAQQLIKQVIKSQDLNKAFYEEVLTKPPLSSEKVTLFENIAHHMPSQLIDHPRIAQNLIRLHREQLTHNPLDEDLKHTFRDLADKVNIFIEQSGQVPDTPELVLVNYALWSQKPSIIQAMQNYNNAFNCEDFFDFFLRTDSKSDRRVRVDNFDKSDMHQLLNHFVGFIKAVYQHHQQQGVTSLKNNYLKPAISDDCLDRALDNIKGDESINIMTQTILRDFAAVPNQQRHLTCYPS